MKLSRVVSLLLVLFLSPSQQCAKTFGKSDDDEDNNIDVENKNKKNLASSEWNIE